MTVLDPEQAELAKFLPKETTESHVDEVQSPMTGTVVSVVAKAGDFVRLDAK